MGHRFQHHPFLGSVLDIWVEGLPDGDADRVDAVAAAEVARLEQVFSAYRPDSDLERWKRGELPDPGDEFCEAMRLALDWQVRSGGAFNTATGELTRIWQLAAGHGSAPTGGVLATAAAAIAEPRFVIDDDGRPVPTGDCAQVNLNAFVKGWIVDRALAVAVELGGDAMSCAVGVGGDLAHAGPVPLEVRIENPLRPYDNEPPLVTVSLAGAGLATSGRARRGVRVGDEWHSHVVDPRTGHTVDHHASITVVAADAATADVVATIAGVLPAADAVGWAGREGFACLVVDRTGGLHTNPRWDAITRE